MRLLAIELVVVELPLVRPFRTSFGTEHHREALLVHVEGPGEEGWGECVTGPEPRYSSEWTDGAFRVLEAYFAPLLLASGEVKAADIDPLLAGFKGHRMAKAALELAVLDAECRAEGKSLRERFGGTRDRVTPGVSVGITDTLAQLLEVVAAHREEGYRRVKLKIEPGFDLEPVAAVRALLGEGFDLQVDANTAYGRRDADHLAGLDEFGLLLVEQPLSEDDLLGHVELARRLSTPICLDESLTCLETTADAIELGACEIANLKAGRVGGYLEAVRIHDHCRSLGVPVWCGGMLETGIGRAANLALASLPGFVLPGDVSATDRYFHEDITTPFVLEEGAIEVPSGPGLGVEVDRATLERLTTRRWHS